MNSLSVSFTGRASQFCGSVPKPKQAPYARRLKTPLNTDSKMPGQVAKPAPVTSIIADMQALGLNMAGAEYFSVQSAYGDSIARMNGLTRPQQTLLNNHQLICQNQGILAEDLAWFSQQAPKVQSANEMMQERFAQLAKSSVALIAPLQKAASHYNAAKKNQELIEGKWHALKQQKLDDKLDATALEILGKAFGSVSAAADELAGKYDQNAGGQAQAVQDQLALSKELEKEQLDSAAVTEAINRLSQTIHAQTQGYRACQKALKALAAHQTSAIEAQVAVLDQMAWILEPDKVKLRQAEQAARKGKKLDVQA